jgi:hypothetical protein
MFRVLSNNENLLCLRFPILYFSLASYSSYPWNLSILLIEQFHCTEGHLVLCRWRCYIKHAEFHNVGHLFVGKWYMCDINILHINLVSQIRYIYVWKNRIKIIQTNKCTQFYQNYNNIKKNQILHVMGLVGPTSGRSFSIQLCALWWWTNRAQNMKELVLM